MEYSKEDLMEAKKQIWGVGENMGTEESKKIWEENAQFWDNAMGDESNEFHREVVRPKVTELLSPNPADYILDIAALDKILKLKRQWERQVSLDYLMNEKFVQFAASEPDEEYPFTVCGQTVLLCNAALADAISVLPEQTREEILRYYFLRQPQRVIGACIGRSRSTAGRHIQLALQRLREEMGVSRYE